MGIVYVNETRNVGTEGHIDHGRNFIKEYYMLKARSPLSKAILEVNVMLAKGLIRPNGTVKRLTLYSKPEGRPLIKDYEMP